MEAVVHAPQKFEDTPEAQEYIQKLHQGRQKLPDEASALECEAHKQFQALQRQLFEQNTRRDQDNKQISVLQSQVQQLGRQIDTTQGQLAAYAQLLVSAEAPRRAVEDLDNEATEDKPTIALAPEPEPEPVPPAAPKSSKKKK